MYRYIDNYLNHFMKINRLATTYYKHLCINIFAIFLLNVLLVVALKQRVSTTGGRPALEKLGRGADKWQPADNRKVHPFESSQNLSADGAL